MQPNINIIPVVVNPNKLEKKSPATIAHNPKMEWNKTPMPAFMECAMLYTMVKEINAVPNIIKTRLFETTNSKPNVVAKIYRIWRAFIFCMLTDSVVQHNQKNCSAMQP